MSSSFNDDSNSHPVSSTTKLEKKDIEKLIAQESSRIAFVEIKLRAAVYQSFNQVVVDEKKVNFVACKICNAVYVWISASGNNSLHRHSCDSSNLKRGCNKPVSSSVEQYMRKSVPQASVHALNKSITFGLLKDMRSLHSVEGIGFLHMAQSFINFGAKYGNQQVGDFVQHRTTLRRTYVPELCAEAQHEYKSLFESMPPNHKFAFSKDMWSEKFNQRYFLSMSCHVINDNWELMSITLGLDELVEKKTVENIRVKCREMLKPYFDESRIPYIIEQSYSVTDGGSNMLNVFVHQLPCQCHKVNLFVDWTLNEKPLPKEEDIQKRIMKRNPYNPKNLFNLQTHCPVIKESVAGVKSIVTHFKQTGLNSKLSNTLKQEVATRWNSELILLESYQKVRAEVEAILLETRQFEKLIGVDNDVINELIEFLKPVRKCSETLSGEKHPTINLVALEFHLLRHEIGLKDTDSDVMKILKRQAAICFDEYLVVTDFLYVACMLDPTYRQLNFVGRDKREDAICLFKTLVDEKLSLCDPKTVCAESASTKVVKKNGPSRFDQFKDINNIHSEYTDEVSEYLAYNFSLEEYTDENGYLDLLRFWKNTNLFPNVKKLAREVLAIPAGETADERNFSSSGQIMTPRRTLLSSESLCESVFIHKSVLEPKNKL